MSSNISTITLVFLFLACFSEVTPGHATIQLAWGMCVMMMLLLREDLWDCCSRFFTCQVPSAVNHRFKTLKQNCDYTESSSKTQMYCCKIVRSITVDNYREFKCVNILIPLCRVTVSLIFVAFDVRIVLNYDHSASFLERREVARLLITITRPLISTKWFMAEVYHIFVVAISGCHFS